MKRISATEAARILSQMRRREVKKCERCGKEFEGYIHQKYCSIRCARRASARRCYLRKKEMAMRESSEGKQS